jgi:hypothetical protein
MAIPRWLIRLLCWSIALIFVAVAAWYGPMVTAAGWHVLHPRGWVNYRGLHVRVPWPWISDVDTEKDEQTAAFPEGISLKKMASTTVRHAPAQSIFITVISPDPGVTAEQQTAAWVDAFRATHPGSHFDETTAAAIPAGSTCLSARKQGDDRDVVWTCISVRDGWVANFEGHASEVPVFFRVVAALKH